MFEPSALRRVHDSLNAFLGTLHSIEVASKSYRVRADPQLAMRQKKEGDAKVAERAERLRDVLLEGFAVDQRHLDKRFEIAREYTLRYLRVHGLTRKQVENHIRTFFDQETGAVL